MRRKDTVFAEFRARNSLLRYQNRPKSYWNRNLFRFTEDSFRDAPAPHCPIQRRVYCEPIAKSVKPNVLSPGHTEADRARSAPTASLRPDRMAYSVGPPRFPWLKTGDRSACEIESAVRPARLRI